MPAAGVVAQEQAVQGIVLQIYLWKFCLAYNLPADFKALIGGRNSAPLGMTLRLKTSLDIAGFTACPSSFAIRSPISG